MSDFKDRLLTEKTELNEKRSKLEGFITSEGFTKIDPVQKSLLHVQLQAMGTYAECLTQRISWLNPENEVAETISFGAVSNGLIQE